jgi:hypothetical protein
MSGDGYSVLIICEDICNKLFDGGEDAFAATGFVTVGTVV